MAEIISRVRPTPTAGYLHNPHRGCCTFQRFNGDALFPGTMWSEEGPLEFPPPPPEVLAMRQTPMCVDGYLPTTVSYCRWFWRVMEPEKGRFNFSMIDQALETAKQRAQTLAVRLMSFGSLTQPDVPDWYSSSCPMMTRSWKSSHKRIPVHDAPEYLEHWGALIREFARRYDGHPGLESIDLAFIGPWGEGDGEASQETIDRFTAVWQEAFATTPRLAQLVGTMPQVGVASGAGWRHDCFGDDRFGGSTTVPKPLSYNAMYDDFAKLVQGAVKDAWKTAPVHFESCSVPMHWYKNDYDIDFIIEQGLKLHGTYFMPKSTRLPEKWMDKLDMFCRKLGYRYVYRQAMIERQVKAGGSFKFSSWIENVGVAPIYRRYDFALRLRQGDHEEIIPFKDIDIRQWLPGDEWIERSIKLPDSIQRGYIELSAGLIDAQTKEARVAFAVKEQYSDRWVALGGIEVV